MRRRTWWAGVHPRVACRPARTSRPTIHLRGDAELRGQRAAGVLPPNRVGFSSHSHANPVLDVRAHPDGDRRRHRWRGLSDPSGCGPALPCAGSRRGVGADLQLGPGAVHAPNYKELAPGSTPDGRRHSRQSKYAAAPLRLLDVGGEADGRFLRTNDLGPLDARYFVNSPGAEGGGIFNLVQTQFTPRIIRNLLCQTPLSAQPILGNGSTLQISCDCWSNLQDRVRLFRAIYPIRQK